MTISPAAGLPAPAAGHPYPTAPTDLGLDELGGAARTLAASLGRAIFDRREAIELVVISVLAGGHVLLEDLPGTGKTTLARALAQSLGGELRRVQARPTCCRPTSPAAASGTPRVAVSYLRPVRSSATSCSWTS